MTGWIGDTIRAFGVLLLMSAVVPNAGAATAQTDASSSDDSVAPLTVDEVVNFTSMPTRNAPVLSPDGRRVAFTVEGPQRTLGRIERLLDETRNAWAEVRVADVETGEARVIARQAWAPAWSPDGSRLAYLAVEAGDVRLRVVDVTENGPGRTVSEAPVWGTWMWVRPRWTPDGENIVVKLLPVGMSTTEALANADPGSSSQESTSARFHPEADLDLLRSDEARPEVPSAPALDQGTTRIPGWMRVAYGGDLALVDVETGAISRLTEGRRPMTWRVSPEGDQVAFIDMMDVEATGVAFQLMATPLDGASEPARILASPVRQVFARGVSWSPDGRRLAYGTTGDVETAGLFVVEADGASPARRVAGHPIVRDAELPPTWTSDGEALLSVASDTIWRIPTDMSSDPASGPNPLAAVPGHEIGTLITPRVLDHRRVSDGSVLARIGERGTTKAGFARIDTDDGRVLATHTSTGSFGGQSRTDVSADGRVAVAVYSNTREAPELWRLADDLRPEHPVSNMNPGFELERLGEDLLVRWETDDGEELVGTLLVPPGIDTSSPPESPLPVVVEVYGGNSGAGALDTFDRHRQLIASHGYAVFVPSIPLRTGTPMADHARAINPAVERLIDMGWADPERVGVTGHSYGGYGTLAALVGSDRFAAGVASAAQGDLFANYGHMTPDGSDRTAWSEGGQGRMGGTPWEFPERFEDNSPSRNLDRINTPVLLLHGTEDPTVPVWLAEAVFVGLRKLGQPVALARYEGEGHWFGDWTSANQVDYWSRVLNWFQRWMPSRIPSEPSRPIPDDAPGAG